MKKFFLLLVVLSIFSCGEKIEKPKKFLEKEEMTNLLYDLTLLTSGRSLYTNDSIWKEYTAQNIFMKYDLDSLSFVALNDYYVKHPAIYAEIYDSINKRYQLKIQEIETLPDDPRDTIGMVVSKLRKFNFQ